MAKSQTNENGNLLKRDLKIRHIQMIAFGGVIGTGLFQSIGSTIRTAGPGGALVAYLAVGIMVFFIMSGLGEMATFLPVTGSFETYAEKFVDPSFSFANGWNYWFSWTMTIAAEIVGCSIAMSEWFPEIPRVLWCVIFLFLLITVNLLSAKVYGESEFWFAGIKVVTVILFLIIGTLLIFGVFTGKPVGFQNLTVGEAPFVGGIKSVFFVFLLSGYAFQGEEMLGITAGESKDPETSIRKAVHSIFFRVLVFYVGAIFIIGCLLPYTDASLDTSPFTMVFKEAGIPAAAMIMNIVVLTAVLSCGNSGMYCASRMLYAMAKEKKAPAFLGGVNRHGVPLPAVLMTGLISALCLLSGLYAADTVYLWLINASALCGFITWFSITLSHVRFRLGYLKQGHDAKNLKFRAPFFPIGPILTLIVCFIVIFGQGFTYLQEDTIDWMGIITSYSSIPIFLILMLIHKRRHKTRFVRLDAIDYTVGNDDPFSEG